MLETVLDREDPVIHKYIYTFMEPAEKDRAFCGCWASLHTFLKQDFNFLMIFIYSV